MLWWPIIFTSSWAYSEDGKLQQDRLQIAICQLLIDEEANK